MVQPGGKAAEGELMEREYRSNRARISSVVARERAGDNRHKLRHTKFPLSLKKKKKNKVFFSSQCEVGQTLAQVARGGCWVSFLGDYKPH